MSEQWHAAQLVWVTPKTNSDGARAYEVIYEMDEDPDNLKQGLVDGHDIYEDAKRHDRVHIMEGETLKIRRAE